MRGAGDSDGVLKGEYLKQEQDDALEVLKWIAAQPWSTGSVGVIGISWGGFNGLQIAARRNRFGQSRSGDGVRSRSTTPGLRRPSSQA